MRDWWDGSACSYPDQPYNHDRFRRHYSDHHPVVFRLASIVADDQPMVMLAFPL